jgi:hypothetical protein
MLELPPGICRVDFIFYIIFRIIFCIIFYVIVNIIVNVIVNVIFIINKGVNVNINLPYNESHSKKEAKKQHVAEANARKLLGNYSDPFVYLFATVPCFRLPKITIISVCAVKDTVPILQGAFLLKFDLKAVESR